MRLSLRRLSEHCVVRLVKRSREGPVVEILLPREVAAASPHFGPAHAAASSTRFASAGSARNLAEPRRSRSVSPSSGILEPVPQKAPRGRADPPVRCGMRQNHAVSPNPRVPSRTPYFSDLQVHLQRGACRPEERNPLHRQRSSGLSATSAITSAWPTTWQIPGPRSRGLACFLASPGDAEFPRKPRASNHPTSTSSKSPVARVGATLEIAKRRY